MCSIKSKKQIKSVREGNYLAEVDVELIVSDESWSSYLSPKDATKLDTVREALKNEDIKRASEMAKVYFLKSVAS